MTDEQQATVVLAFDFGMKRIGVAIGQRITGNARPLTTLPATAGTPNWDTVTKLIKHWGANALVVGLPLNMDGTDQPITARAHQFAQELSERTTLPVYTMDERLTTKEARELLFGKGGFKALQDGQVDSVAAQLILQNWFQEQDKTKR